MAKSKKKNSPSDLDVTELERRVDKAKTLLEDLGSLFPEAHLLSKADRQRSQRLGLEEAEVLQGVIDAIDMLPAVFASLADHDEGEDPTELETDLLRARFRRHQLYATIATEVSALAQRLTDAALTVGSLVKPVTLAAYEIAKPISKRNPALREKIAGALDYYGGNAAAALASRRARIGTDEAGPPEV